MKYKWIFFAISLLVILPGLISLMLFGLNLSIDFTGGSLLEISVPNSSPNTLADLKKIITTEKITIATAQSSSRGVFIFRTKEMNNQKKDEVMVAIKKQIPQAAESRFATVGPTIGKELTVKAFQAMAVASLAIILYIAYAFREIPKPYSAWKFGVTAVVALLHDALVVVGVFSLLGHYFHVEVDALFVTALLTVIGFSVHDTIVVFDRVRENLRKGTGKVSFEGVVNESLVQTLGRSLTTSLTVLFTLLALILFGGESVRWFVVALFVGVLSGTYSSIFNAAPLLVLWEERKKK